MKQENKQLENKKIVCPNCKSENTIKWTKRNTENRGLIQRYKCKDCGKTFTKDDGFFRMRNSPTKITQSIDLFYRGVSTRKVQEHLAIFHPHNAPHMSIYNWVVKYAKMISKFTDKIKVNNGNEIQLDEMEFHRRKEHNKRGVSKDWFVDSIDCKTRFLLSAEYVKSRGKKEITYAFKETKEKTNNDITICTTDGFLTYPDVIKKVFRYYSLKKKEIVHNRVNVSQGEGFNIYIERLHNSIRRRTEGFRGFHGLIESASSIMKGFTIFYNYIRRHQSLGVCPYELATDLKLKENNRWLGLIELSNINN